ncbi:YciI family protein [Kribbella sp. NBC_01245]|uniref:YciI family protein n=1 Tax=Kribbella sp. NBC_01245 TaxID=2903578 RepID=UPI002E29E65A|nr:YciI family protein [Kribbella sp. NBC_01245]
MKFLMIMNINPAIWDALTEAERDVVTSGHGEFMATVRASGELIDTVALAEPAKSAVVRVQNGAPVVTDGPFVESKEFLGGYYFIECADQARAYELAAMIPDAAVPGAGVEVRPVVFSADLTSEGPE